MSDEEKINPLLCKESPWKNNPNSIWLGSTLTLIRNLEKFNFPGKLGTDKRNQIVYLLKKIFLTSKQLKNPKVIRAEDMPPIEKEYLVEHFLSPLSFHQAYVGEAFILDETGEFLAVLNLKDHLLLESVDTEEDVEKSWNQLVNIEFELSQSVNFAFSPKFGFLTSDPNLCGSGFILRIFLHLPALIYTHQLDEMIKKNSDDSIEQTGLQGDPHELIGDIVAFHNRYTLGVTEENILSCLRSLAVKLVLEEKRARQHLKEGSEAEVAEVKNKISRAYAILLHSYQIEVIESLEALSHVKLGLDLGWLKGVSQSTVNKLLFACRRAHLLCHYGQKFPQEELPHRRAEYIHQALHGLELLI